MTLTASMIRRGFLLGTLGALVVSCSDSGFEDDAYPDLDILAPGEVPVSWSETGAWVVANGIWQMDGQQSVGPFYEVVEIECYRDSMSCDLAAASVNNFGADRLYLAAQASGADVERWTDDQLEFTDTYFCFRGTTTLSRADGSAVRVREYMPEDDNCGAAEAREEEGAEVPSREPRLYRMITAEEWRRRTGEGLE